MIVCFRKKNPIFRCDAWILCRRFSITPVWELFEDESVVFSIIIFNINCTMFHLHAFISQSLLFFKSDQFIYIYNNLYSCNFNSLFTKSYQVSIAYYPWNTGALLRHNTYEQFLFSHKLYFRNNDNRGCELQFVISVARIQKFGRFNSKWLGYTTATNCGKISQQSSCTAEKST